MNSSFSKLVLNKFNSQQEQFYECPQVLTKIEENTSSIIKKPRKSRIKRQNPSGFNQVIQNEDSSLDIQQLKPFQNLTNNFQKPLSSIPTGSSQSKRSLKNKSILMQRNQILKENIDDDGFGLETIELGKPVFSKKPSNTCDVNMSKNGLPVMSDLPLNNFFGKQKHEQEAKISKSTNIHAHIKGEKHKNNRQNQSFFPKLTDLSITIFDQIPSGKTVSCKLYRNKKNFQGNVQFNVYQQNTKKHLLTIKKQGMWSYGMYAPQLKNKPIATLESTFFGNNYSLFIHDQKYSSLTITYETSFMGLSGPRRIHVYRPKTFVPQKYLHECYEESQWHQNIQKFVNKQPQWIQKQNSYVLDFKGKAKKSSIKNFVITDGLQKTDKYYILFAKDENEAFNLDIEWPFSVIQGIATAQTTFDFKLNCD